MLSFRPVILLSFAALLLGTSISAQTVPTQPQQVVQQPFPHSPFQQSSIQQGTIQQQPIQAQPIKAPLFGTQGNTSVYQQNPYQQNPNLPQTTAQSVAPQMPTGAPIRVATANPSQPVAVQELPPGMNHMGHAAPANKIIPFFLNPTEQQELDQFLARWEKYSAGIKRYDVDFNVFMYDSTIPGAEPNKAYKVAFGYFKYIANPIRFVYVVEGEWQDKKQIKRDGEKNPNILAEKTIIDEKTVFQYDYRAKTMVQINVPPEMIGRGIADSPLPLIFGAKADELKQRFSMKIVSVPDQDDIIWLQARPLLLEDQQEFKELEIMLNKRTLNARGLKQMDINEKAYKVYDLNSPKINDRLTAVLQDIKDWFTPDVPRGWKHEEMNWIAQPSPAPMVSQPPIGNPQLPQSPSPSYRNEIPLYKAQ